MTNLLRTKAKKKKKSLYKPGQVLKVLRGRGSQITRQSAHEGGKVVSTSPWPPGRITSMKNSIDTIENRNRLWLVDQWFNEQRLLAPPNIVQLTASVLYIC